MQSALLNHIDVWTSAIETRSTAGRGSSNKLNLYGIKKLRELIFELAVRGQLVPQNPDDEPASVLLEKIAAEKARLIKDGKLKKQEPLPPITDDEKPFELPVGWKWVRLDEVCLKITDGEHLSPNKASSGVMLLTAKHVLETGVVIEDPQFVSEDDAKKFRLRCDPTTGDILICSRGTIGRSCVVSISDYFCLMGSVIQIRVLDGVNSSYLDCFLKSNSGQLFIRGITKGMAVNALYLKDIKYCSFSVPPEAEQHRIVAKVNELMSLCDALEQEQTANIAAHQTLVEELLAALTSSTPNSPPSLTLPPQGVEGTREKNRAALLLPSPLAGEGLGMGGMPAWARIATHFDTLFTTEHSIDTLSRKIISLAARGMLTSSESLSADLKVSILEKAFLDKNSLIRSGEAKEEKINLLNIEMPYSVVPSGWIVCKLHDVTVCLDHKRDPVKKSNRCGGDIPYYGANGAVGYIDDFLFDDELVLVVEDETFIGRIKPFSYRISGKSWVNNHAHVLKCTSVILPDFLNILLSYYPFIPLTSGTTGRKKLTKNTLLQIPIMLPPFAEQQRIVAKVDELMALCDVMKAQLRTAQTTQLQLADVLAEQVMGDKIK